MYYLFLLGKFIALILPRPAAYKLARLASLIFYYFAKKDRENVRFNLAPILHDEEEIEACAKKVFINFAYYLADFFSSSRLNSKFIKKYIRSSGIEHIEEAQAANKPIIAITAHLGNYELAGATTSLLGYPVAAVALPHADKRVNSFFNKQRQHAGISVIPTGHAIKGCISALKDKKILALLGDRDFSKHGFKMEMFSRAAYLPRGAAFFAKKTEACIIPGFLIRERKYYYHLRFEEPIFVDSQMDEQEIIKRYIPVLESYIKKYPDQWYLFEKYWLTDTD
jgi:lauroyl/myristoyl acyltransferase